MYRWQTSNNVCDNFCCCHPKTTHWGIIIWRHPQTAHLGVQVLQVTLFLLLFYELWILFEQIENFCCATLWRCHFRIYMYNCPCMSESHLSKCTVKYRNGYVNPCIHIENAANGTALQSCRSGASTISIIMLCFAWTVNTRSQGLSPPLTPKSLDSTSCKHVAWE